MAVTLTAAELANAMRVGDTAEETAEVTRLLSYAAEAVVKQAPNAPNPVHNEACVRLASYLFDQPTAGMGDRYANAMRNSGAGRILLPHTTHNLGTVDPADTTRASSADGLRQVALETVTVSTARAWFPTAFPYPSTAVFGVTVAAPDGTRTPVELSLTVGLPGDDVVAGGDATEGLGAQSFALGADSSGGALFFASIQTGAHTVRLFEVS